MYKKISALTLALAFCCAALSGCWWGDDDESSSSNITSSSRPSSSYSSSYSDSNTGSMSGDDSMFDDSMFDDSMSGSMSDSLSGSTSSTSSSESTVANATVDFSSWQLRLANAKNPLPEDFTVKTRNIKGYDSRLFDERAADALEEMLSDAEKNGCRLYLVSAYRSVSRQKALYKKKTEYYIEQGKIREEAEAEAAKWVARPGTSEHNLGLAADIVSSDWYRTNTDLTADFENTRHFEWLRDNCAEYGFIIRYPKDKQDITGITYEPWHYRYVGNTAAKEIMQKGICLEEYLSE